MRIIIKLVFVSLLFISCQQKITPLDVFKVNGYWEIEKVSFNQGEDKNYTLNESYDYFEIEKNSTGFRKKVSPQLDGTFLVNKTQETIKIRFEKDRVYFDYTTPYDKWSEELIMISKDKMILKNLEDKEYHYKKTEAINILGNGKKIK